MDEQITKILEDVGGKLWEKNSMKRIYFNRDVVIKAIKLDVDYYNTGNVSGATLEGDAISNSEAKRILSGIDKVWYDFADGKFHWNENYDNHVSGFCKSLREKLNQVTA